MLAVFAICIFFSATVPLITLACAFYALVRHIVDAMNIITVYRKEIDSQCQLIEVVTNTGLIVTLSYQVCMAGFLAFKERDSECLTCICILVCSILFIVISYERVDDHGEF